MTTGHGLAGGARFANRGNSKARTPVRQREIPNQSYPSEMIFRQSETIAFMRRCKAKDFFAKLSLIWPKLRAESIFWLDTFLAFIVFEERY